MRSYILASSKNKGGVLEIGEVMMGKKDFLPTNDANYSDEEIQVRHSGHSRAFLSPCLNPIILRSLRIFWCVTIFRK